MLDRYDEPGKDDARTRGGLPERLPHERGLPSKEQVCAQTKYAINCGSYTTTCNAFQNENNLGCNFTTTKTTWNCTVDSTLYDVDAAPGLELKVGSTAIFTYIVKNTGDTALKNVVLTDDRITAVNYVSGDTNGNGWLDVNETWTYKAQETVVAGTIKNTGTVTGIDAVGGVAKVTDADDAYYTGYNTSSTKGSLGDRVWEDKNYNGVQDAGESGVSGVKVTLRGAGANGVFGDSDDVTSVTYTNASGNYEFNNLAAGKYKIEVTTPSSYFITKQNQGANDASDSDIGSTGVTSEIVLGAGEHNKATIDAGIYRKASVGDKVDRDDMDHKNNVQDASEAGVANIVVQAAQRAGGTVLATTTTDSNGNYLFEPDTGGLPHRHRRVDAAVRLHLHEIEHRFGQDVRSAHPTADLGHHGQHHAGAGEDDRSWDAGVYKVGIDVEKYVSGTVCTTVNNCSGEGQTSATGSPTASGTAAWATTAGPAPASSTT
ncbi:MAG: SdrD B-like domain-containing protein [Rhodoferax sp.]